MLENFFVILLKKLFRKNYVVLHPFIPKDVIRFKGRLDKNPYCEGIAWEEYCKIPSHAKGDNVYIKYVDGTYAFLKIIAVTNYGGYQKYHIEFTKMPKK